MRTDTEVLPGLSITSSRLVQIRKQIAAHDHAVSYRREGRPFVPEGKGYNRADGMQDPPDEFAQLSPYVMRHRSRGRPD